MNTTKLHKDLSSIKIDLTHEVLIQLIEELHCAL